MLQMQVCFPICYRDAAMRIQKPEKSSELHEAAKRDDLELVRARELLRRASLRATSPRLAVLRTLLRERRPLSHAEVSDVLRADGFDRVTVFRNLHDLAEAGILSRVDVGDHTWRFEMCTEASTFGTRHSHFVCERCNEVSCLYDFSTNSLPQSLVSRAIIGSVAQVVLRGCCRQC
jgi:Fur family transcriptional regulator, ferric uptake regulator